MLLSLFKNWKSSKIVILLLRICDKQYLFFRLSFLISFLIYSLLYIADLFLSNYFIARRALLASDTLTIMYYLLFILFLLYCCMTMKTYKDIILPLFYKKINTITLTKEELVYYNQSCRNVHQFIMFGLLGSSIMLIFVLFIGIMSSVQYIYFMVSSIVIVLLMFCWYFYARAARSAYNKFNFLNGLFLVEQNEITFEYDKIEYLDSNNIQIRRWVNFKFGFILILTFILFVLSILMFHLSVFEWVLFLSFFSKGISFIIYVGLSCVLFVGNSIVFVIKIWNDKKINKSNYKQNQYYS